MSDCSSSLGLVCAGETPQLTSGDVFVDIDDEEPLVPDQVKPSYQLVKLKVLCINNT